VVIYPGSRIDSDNRLRLEGVLSRSSGSDPTHLTKIEWHILLTRSYWEQLSISKAEASFVAKMDDHISKGMDFQSFIKDTLCEFLGESPAEVLYFSIGTRAMHRPDMFAEKLTDVFGLGASAIFRELENRAEEDTASKVHDQVHAEKEGKRET
jgi:hypothetical protein